jgi:hypothetical protein
MPADPGKYTIEATAPDRAPWKTTIDVGPQMTTWSVHVPELEPATGDADSLSREQLHPPARPDRHASWWSVPRTAAVVTAGSALLALGGSAFFTASALGKKAEAEPHCNGSTCDQTGGTLLAEAVAAGNAATGFLVVGGALVVASGVLWFVAQSRVEVTAGLGRIHLQGSF